MGLKTWITGMFLSATLSGQAQEAQPEATQQKQDTTEVNAPAASITDVAQHMQKVRKSLTDKAHLNFNQQLNNEFGPNGSRISSSATIRQAAQQDVSLVMPEMQAKLFNQDMQKILQEEFQTTMSDFQKRVEKRTTELHTKYGDFIANGATDNPNGIGIKGNHLAFNFRLQYDMENNRVFIKWEPQRVTKRLTPLGKKLQSKKSRKEILSEY
jgi:hypothetical protein